MKAVVFGGSGFLGSHVADALSDRGHIVTVFDRSRSSWLREDQSIVVGDISDPGIVADVVQGADFVYNFAAIADIGEAQDDPITSAKINVLGNLNVLEACANSGVKRFVYASTLYVYSEAGGFYRCSKQASELYVEEFSRSRGLSFTVLRYGSLYGPRSSPRNGLRQIVSRALADRQLVYSGREDAVREYIHVRDAAASSVEILSDQFADRHVVITGQQSVRIRDVLETVGEILGVGPHEVQFKEAPGSDHYVRTPYSYNPRLAVRMTPNVFIDFGQGLIELMQDIDSRGE